MTFIGDLIAKFVKSSSEDEKKMFSVSSVICTYAARPADRTLVGETVQLEVTSKRILIGSQKEASVNKEFPVRILVSVKPHYTEYPDLITSDENQETLCKSCGRRFPQQMICPVCAILFVKNPDRLPEVSKYGFKFGTQTDRDHFVESVSKLLT